MNIFSVSFCVRRGRVAFRHHRRGATLAYEQNVFCVYVSILRNQYETKIIYKTCHWRSGFRQEHRYSTVPGTVPGQ